MDIFKGEEFGLQVWTYAGNSYRVSLPHQCDDWIISGWYGTETGVDQAISDLKQFIFEAQDALTALERERERVESETSLRQT